MSHHFRDVETSHLSWDAHTDLVALIDGEHGIVLSELESCDCPEEYRGELCQLTLKVWDRLYGERPAVMPFDLAVANDRRVAP